MSFSHWKRWLLIAAAVMVVSACSEAPSSPFDGKPAPDFAVSPLKPAGDISLSQYKGKVVVLDFWATWCGPCRQIMPELATFQEKYKDQGFEVIGITAENRTTVQKFFEAMGPIGYTIALDSQLQANNRYRIGSLPTTVLIGRDGNVIHYEVGVDNSVGLAPLEERIKQALQQKV